MAEQSTILMTTEEYSKSGHKLYKGKLVSQQAIRKACKNKRTHLLPNVLNIKKAGKYYLLEVAI